MQKESRKVVLMLADITVDSVFAIYNVFNYHSNIAYKIIKHHLNLYSLEHNVEQNVNHSSRDYLLKKEFISYYGPFVIASFTALLSPEIPVQGIVTNSSCNYLGYLCNATTNCTNTPCCLNAKVIKESGITVDLCSCYWCFCQLQWC